MNCGHKKKSKAGIETKSTKNPYLFVAFTIGGVARFTTHTRLDAMMTMAMSTDGELDDVDEVEQ